jgi:LysM repeat protein
MDQRARRSPARFLAPLALIAVVVALLAIISGSGTSSSSTTNEPTNTSVSTTTTTKKKSSSAKSKTKTTKTSAGPETYTVQVGDTLGGIATKTGVPLSKIQELNPNVDPHTMNAGQEIRLR